MVMRTQLATGVNLKISGTLEIDLERQTRCKNRRVATALAQRAITRVGMNNIHHQPVKKTSVLESETNTVY